MGNESKKNKYYQKILEGTKVTHNCKTKIEYRVILVVGDGKSKVGIGIGRAKTSYIAGNRAFINAKQNLISVPVTRNKSIPGEIKIVRGPCKILLSPASKNTGIIASGPIKTLMEYGGIKNVTAKQLGSNSILNNIKATLLALALLKDRIKLLEIESSKNYIFYAKKIKSIRK